MRISNSTKSNNQGLLDKLEALRAGTAITAAERELAQAEKTSIDYDRIRSVAQQYNENPSSLNDLDVEYLKKAAPMIGEDISKGIAKDKGSAWGKAGAFAAGIGDSLLFDLVPDRWYTNRHTKGWANAGKIAGTIGSLAYGGFQAAGMLGKAGLSGAKLAASLTAASDDVAKAGVGFMAKYGDDIARVTGTERAVLDSMPIQEVEKMLSKYKWGLEEGSKRAIRKALGREIGEGELSIASVADFKKDLFAKYPQYKKMGDANVAKMFKNYTANKSLYVPFRTATGREAGVGSTLKTVRNRITGQEKILDKINRAEELLGSRSKNISSPKMLQKYGFKNEDQVLRTIGIDKASIVSDLSDLKKAEIQLMKTESVSTMSKDLQQLTKNATSKIGGSGSKTNLDLVSHKMAVKNQQQVVDTLKSKMELLKKEAYAEGSINKLKKATEAGNKYIDSVRKLKELKFKSRINSLKKAPVNALVNLPGRWTGPLLKTAFNSEAKFMPRVGAAMGAFGPAIQTVMPNLRPTPYQYWASGMAGPILTPPNQAIMSALPFGGKLPPQQKDAAAVQQMMMN